jgi:SAM-dependent methyltransferase
VISADQEREFYDQHYAQFLSRPPAELAYSRAQFERDLDDPAKPVWERRALYRAALGVFDKIGVRGLRVLDYGCGPGDWGLVLASMGASVTFLELSPVAIELCRRRAAASGLACDAVARDATDLSCFTYGQFDLVVACASLHHTLKYPNAVAELARVVQPQGHLVLIETWGGNPVLNIVRRIGWKLRGQAEEQGEDILFDRTALRLLEPAFQEVELRFLNLLGMGKRLLRGHYGSRSARAVIAALGAFDRVLLSTVPPLRSWCGEVVVTARRS